MSIEIVIAIIIGSMIGLYGLMELVGVILKVSSKWGEEPFHYPEPPRPPKPPKIIQPVLPSDFIDFDNLETPVEPKVEDADLWNLGAPLEDKSDELPKFEDGDMFAGMNDFMAMEEVNLNVKIEEKIYRR